MSAHRSGETVAYRGDCLEVMATLATLGTQVDSIVTDPPYHLSTVKRFATGAPAQYGTDGLYQRASKGFMGKEWDGGDVAFDPETWRRCWSLLKPGGYLLAFSGSRTYHRMACAIEDAGFEIRDQLMWLYGTGFPKSHDVSKAIDKAAGVTGCSTDGASGKGTETVNAYGNGLNVNFAPRPQYVPESDAAQRWEGWGTALKPAHEPIVMARKPLIGTVAENVLTHGTGAINIDACRIHTAGSEARAYTAKRLKPGATLEATGGAWQNDDGVVYEGETKAGRFPANVIHDGSDEVLAYLGDAARFFYCAKASKADRAGSKHPTVKPISLINYLATMTTRPGGVVLDPFAGSGTLAAAWPRSILIEREEEYYSDILRRLAA